MLERRSLLRSGPLGAGLAAVLIAAGITLPGRAASAQELRSLYQQVKPSVVVIRTEQKLQPSGESGATRVEGLGSGVLISNDGTILTAAHIVRTVEKVEVQFVDGTRQPAKILTLVPSADVALIRVDRIPPSAKPAPLGDSDLMQVGDRVFVVGAPFELIYTLTAGHISGRRVPQEIQGPLSSIELFQTDAAINRGSSGSPMFNMTGEVIGICHAILSQSGGFQGLGFAVTSNFARKVFPENAAIRLGIDGP